MNELQIIELFNQRLLTTEQLADFYEASETQIKTNFNRNKEKFIQGKHFYLLEGEELREFKSRVTNCNLPISKFSSQLYLWTKQGASRHSKMLGTDRAWDMYDELEENYFNPKKQLQIPTSQRELAQLALAANEETNERVDLIENEIEDIKNNQLLTEPDYRTISNMVRQKIRIICDQQHLNSKAKTELFKDLNSSIKRITGAAARNRIKAKQFDDVVKFINNWMPSSATMTIIDQMDLLED